MAKREKFAHEIEEDNEIASRLKVGQDVFVVRSSGYHNRPDSITEGLRINRILKNNVVEVEGLAGFFKMKVKLSYRSDNNNKRKLCLDHIGDKTYYRSQQQHFVKDEVGAEYLQAIKDKNEWLLDLSSMELSLTAISSKMCSHNPEQIELTRKFIEEFQAMNKKEESGE